MSPKAIMQNDVAKAAKAKSESNKNAKSMSSKKDEIRLKGHCLLATKSDINELIASTLVAYALVCKDVLISIHDMQHSLPGCAQSDFHARGTLGTNHTHILLLD
jgi:hypothetical protein